MHKASGRTILAPLSFGSLYSYELHGNRIAVHLLGLLPARSIDLSDVHYLRLATRDEMTPVFLLFNWPQLLPYRRSIRPVYVLQTKDRRRVFLKLDGRTHFKLRQAIGREHEQQLRMAA